jgi:hypothetical protein
MVAGGGVDPYRLARRSLLCLCGGPGVRSRSQRRLESVCSGPEDPFPPLYHSPFSTAPLPCALHGLRGAAPNAFRRMTKGKAGEGRTMNDDSFINKFYYHRPLARVNDFFRSRSYRLSHPRGWNRMIEEATGRFGLAPICSGLNFLCRRRPFSLTSLSGFAIDNNYRFGRSSA